MGAAWEGGDDPFTKYKADWNPTTTDDCSDMYTTEGTGFSNVHWYGAKVYVGSSTNLADLTFCGYAGSS